VNVTEGDALAERKRRIRREQREARLRIPESVRDADAARIAERVLNLPEARSASTVALFSSFGAEVPTEPLIRAFQARGARVLLPYLDAGEIAMAEYLPGADLVPTSYGAREPAVRTAVDPAAIELVIVPGLAFDRRGNRLGYGGGFYDRFLRRLDATALAVGIGFAQQVVAAVPAGRGDQSLHVVITPVETIRVRRATGGP
jgi:5-formyltetrahydrofolate cyclo-ligase